MNQSQSKVQSAPHNATQICDKYQCSATGVKLIGDTGHSNGCEAKRYHHKAERYQHKGCGSVQRAKHSGVIANTVGVGSVVS